MQLHIDNAYKIIDGWLPSNYVNKVLDKLNDKTLTSGIVRNIKNRITEYPKTRLEVLNALVEVAKEHKGQFDKLKENTKDN